MAVSALWAAVDKDNVVRQYVVRKDTHFDVRELRDKTRWQEAVPLEWVCHVKVQNQSDASNVVQALAHEVDMASLHYRLYTAYCPLGDLQSLLTVNYDAKTTIPSAYIWMVLDKLIDCGLVQEKGTISEMAEEGWQEVVHRDIKPPNVFLDEEGSDWPGYPQPKLGDFGLAIETNACDQFNPMIYNFGAGTPGYLAPEQQKYMDRETGTPVDVFQLLAHTNVWGVGLLIWCLIHGRSIAPQAQPEFYWRTENNKFTCAIERAVGNQHRVFARLVEQCLQFNPADRPSFANLRRAVDKSMPSRIQAAKAGTLGPSEREELHGLPSQRYRVGMAR
jgi:serine/threonine protein kinase